MIRICRPVTDRLQTNYRGYFSDFRYYLIITAMAAAADMATTIAFMLQDGADQELHPAIRITSMILGPILGPVLGKICQFLAIILITVYCRSMAKYVFFAATMMYIWAAWYNIWGREFYSPLLFNLLPL